MLTTTSHQKSYQTNLCMMFGYLGAGKTTATRIIHEFTGAVCFSSDQYRANKYVNPTFFSQQHAEVCSDLDSLCQQLLTQGKGVIYNTNLNRQVHRQ